MFDIYFYFAFSCHVVGCIFEQVISIYAAGTETVIMSAGVVFIYACVYSHCLPYYTIQCHTMRLLAEIEIAMIGKCCYLMLEYNNISIFTSNTTRYSDRRRDDRDRR